MPTVYGRSGATLGGYEVREWRLSVDRYGAEGGSIWSAARTLTATLVVDGGNFNGADFLTPQVFCYEGQSVTVTPIECSYECGFGNVATVKVTARVVSEWAATVPVPVPVPAPAPVPAPMVPAAPRHRRAISFGGA